MSGNRSSWSFLDTSVGQSYFWSLTLTVLPVLSSFIVSWVIARGAGPSVLGTVMWAMAFATALLIVGKFGIELGASRLASEFGVSRPGALRGLLRTSWMLRLTFTVVVAVVTFALAPVIAGWFKDAALTAPIRVAAAIVFCASAYEFQEQFLIGLNRHATVSKVRAVTLLSRVVLTIALVVAGWGAASILSGYCIAWIVGIAAFALMLRRYLPPASEPLEPGVLRRRLLALSVPLAISSASVTIYSQMDKLMLGYFDGVEEVGQYSVARAVSDVSLFPVFAFVMVLRPALASRYSTGAIEECARLIRNSLRLSLVCGVLFASIFAVLSVPLLTLVYSAQFEYAGEIMAVFIWVIALRSLGSLVLPALVAAERTQVYAYLTTFSALVNFVLNLILIPQLHARGAVLATIVSYGVLLVLGLYQVFKVFQVRLGVRAFTLAIRTVLAGAISGTILWTMLGYVDGEGLGAWVFLLGILQATVYGILIMGFRVVRPDDIRLLLGNLLNSNK